MAGVDADTALGWDNMALQRGPNAEGHHWAAVRRTDFHNF